MPSHNLIRLHEICLSWKTAKSPFMFDSVLILHHNSFVRPHGLSGPTFHPFSSLLKQGLINSEFLKSIQLFRFPFQSSLANKY